MKIIGISAFYHGSAAEFPELRKRYWGQRFWARGYFCTTSGNVTNETILNYIANHTEDEPTGNRR